MSTSKKTKNELAELRAEMADIAAKAGSLFGTGGNLAMIPVNTLSVNQGATQAIIAVCQLVCKYTGIFRWSVTSEAAAAVPADLINSWIVTSQTGVASAHGATYTGTAAVLANNAVGAGSLGIIPGDSPGSTTALCTGAGAAAGTGITVATGGGGSLTQFTKTETLGTAAVGTSIEASGFMVNSITEDATYTLGQLLRTAALGGAPSRFTLGTNVLLCLSYGNSLAGNLAISNVTMSLEEVRG